MDSIRERQGPIGRHVAIGWRRSALLCLTVATAWLGAVAPASAASRHHQRKPAPKWTVESTPTLFGASNGALIGISCLSASDCEAVGHYENSLGVQVTLAEIWTGSSWLIQRTPNPAGSIDTQLGGISCNSPKACTAVGYSENSAGQDADLAERWNGTSWRIVATPNPGSDPGPSGGTCTLGDACVAEGGVEVGLMGVTCRSVNSCVAVGYAENAAGNDVTLAEVWNGAVWRIQNTPNPASSLSNGFSGVSCPAANRCIAVGYTEQGPGTDQRLVEVWNGKRWSIQGTALPAGANNSTLWGITCRSTKACTAVGFYNDLFLVDVPLIETWNGRRWSVSNSPDPYNSVESALFAVSCPTASSCTATAASIDGSMDPQTLVESSNRSSWAIGATPSPSYASATALFGVSCSAANSCEAVGSYENSDDELVPFAEREH
jgi:hypothetical protein